ncbi:hypothetical protein [Pseudomonas thivervalensis]|uniref:hypothetical protein n=1 Tax=Pseudomonas thivervalensis TaxID=86265 RepID=UPI003D6B7D12
MRVQHILPQTRNNPSSGQLTAQIEGDVPFGSNMLNFAYDYYTTDRKLRLTLSAVQTPDDADSERVIRGIEMVFDKDVMTETLTIEDQKVHVTYWKMWAENGQTLFQTNDADKGSVTVSFNHHEESYTGDFAFKLDDCLIEGKFSIKGRDNFTL